MTLYAFRFVHFSILVFEFLRHGYLGSLGALETIDSLVTCDGEIRPSGGWKHEI